jgi:hypothetical protein
MRVWIMMGVGALMLATAVLPSGVWGITMDELKQEMAQNKTPWWGTRLVMYVPMVGPDNKLMPITELCVSGGRLHPMAATATDMGPAQDQYSVVIHMRDGGGYDIYQYERKVSVPECK